MLYTLDSSTSLNVESTLTKIAIALYSSPATNVARIISYILNCEQFTAVWYTFNYNCENVQIENPL